uniref:C2H2-type domain-containing protein n=1 Tax=Megaselia scalaris TaxID=36166 RepID=T1H1W0_MEGSC
MLNINEDFFEHKKQHTNEKNFKCPKCILWFSIAEDYKNHVNKDHEYLENQNSFDIIFSSILEESEMKEKGTSEYQSGKEPCEFCELKFNSINLLRKHKKSMHTESQLFVCKKCPRRFKEKYKIVSHLKKHLIIHSCEFCDKTFNDNISLMFILDVIIILDPSSARFANEVFQQTLKNVLMKKTIQKTELLFVKFAETDSKLFSIYGSIKRPMRIKDRIFVLIVERHLTRQVF